MCRVGATRVRLWLPCLRRPADCTRRRKEHHVAGARVAIPVFQVATRPESAAGEVKHSERAALGQGLPRPWASIIRQGSVALAFQAFAQTVLLLLHRHALALSHRVEDAATAIAFLCMPESSLVTDECLAVDGDFLRYGF